MTQNSVHATNSPAWWNEYFKTDWDRYEGGAQTRAFMRALIEGLSVAERQWLSAESRSILDWGCAQGQGVDELGKALPAAVVKGLDAAQTAIDRARRDFPSHEFSTETPAPGIFDVAVCSNCLEHFEDPFLQAARIAELATDLLIILVPYAEEQLIELHLTRFTEETFPPRIAALDRLRTAVVDVPTWAWPSGKQLLALYASPRCRVALCELALQERERHEWENHYNARALHEIEVFNPIFDKEVVSAIRALLPEGGKVLEADSGGVGQSIALAREPGFEVAVSNSVRQALNYAETRFARARAKARFIEDDVFATGNPEFDLVFNSGALEHYALADQIRLLRGLASRSRRYVMTLVPNGACYWYWIWRIGRASREGWPFGKELPALDVSAAFQGAGLKYLGHCFIGASWVENFIQSLPDCEPDTRDFLCEIHRSGVIPDISRGYLLAAVGCVDDSIADVGHPWERNPLGREPVVSELIATLADALAARFATENALAKLTARKDELELERASERERLFSVREENFRLGGLVERGRTELKLQSEARASAEEARASAEEARASAQRDAALAQQQLEEMSRWAQSISLHPLRFALKRAVLGLLRRVMRILPLSTVQKSRLRGLYAKFRRIGAEAPPNSSARRERSKILPAASGADVYVFGIIDWHFRIQRPQHIAREFARRGHRVFFVSPTFADMALPGSAFERLDPGLPLFQVRLNVAGSPAIYNEAPDASLRAALQASLTCCLLEADTEKSIAIVEHAFWSSIARILPNLHLVYDCMDHHEGFGGVNESILELENRLIEDADLVVTTSDWLAQHVDPRAKRSLIVRNAGDFEHFSTLPAEVFHDPQGRRVIGYFGAIAEWFDIDLLDRIATEFPDCLIMLIGNDTVEAGKRLAQRKNVAFLGERPYAELPYYLHGFSVCLLPFKVLPLTLATNPVKVYEYLAAGKPVVAPALPEMAQFGDLAFPCGDAEAFIAAVRGALAGDEETPERIQARIAFAAANTWADRVLMLEEAIRAVPEPRVSVVVLCYNNLPLTKKCLDSLIEQTDYANLELIIVDNASSDGTRDYLCEFGALHPEARIVLNDDNLGYAAGNNVGIGLATGEYLILLNNDTVVSQGWIRSLLRHFSANPRIGLLGPVTDNIGNEARIQLDCEDPEEVPFASRSYTLAHAGESRVLPTLAFFCVMIPRRVLDRCGSLCEEYGLGWFEDDDYCRRVQAVGFDLVLAEDVFVHHEHSASFGRLPSAERRELFERNKALYESKWGTWVPHDYR